MGQNKFVMLVALLIILGAARITEAQIPTATLSGTVYDPTHSVIPHAQVELKNTASGDVRSVTTNGSGSFTFAVLPSGNYDLSVTANGFSGYKLQNYHVDPGDAREMSDITLSISSSETVVVATSDQHIDTTSGEMSSLITSDDIEHLSVEGRDVTELFKILPGFGNANQDLNNTAYDPGQVTVGHGATFGYVVNGTPANGVSLKLDGANITDPGDYFGTIQNVNYDMVSEVKVQTANFTADQSNGPVNINAVTTAGGKQFHGKLYTYARTSQLNSTDWLASQLGYAKPPDRYIYPGIDLGGPLTIPGTNFNRNGRVTFFAGAEDYAQRNAYAYGAASQAIIHALVPTANMRQGDFSAGELQKYLGLNAKSAAYANVNKVPTVNKNGVAVLNGNVGGTIDPGGQTLLNGLPLPNIASNGSYNYINQNLIANNMWQAIGRVDVSISDRYKLFARYSIERGVTGVPQVAYYSPQGTAFGSVNTPGGGLLNINNSQSLATNLTMILSPTMTNEVFGSFGFIYTDFRAKDFQALTTGNSSYPYAGAYSQNGSMALPQLADYGGNGLPLSLLNDFSYGPLYLKKLLTNAGDNFTKVFGAHTLKLGVYVEQVINNQRNINPPVPTNGALSSYYEGPVITDLDKTKYYSGGNYLANALQGIFGAYTQANSFPELDLYFWNVDSFITDTWKVRNNLTINLGLRAEHLGTWNDKHGVGLAIFDPTTLNQTSNATRPVPGFRWHAIDPDVPTSGVSSRPAFYEPRVGVAWDILGKGRTVLRSGYGQYRYHDSAAPANSAAATATGQFTTNLTGNGGLTLAGISKQHLSQTGGTANAAAANGNVYGLLASDNNAGLTQTYSLAIDQVLPYKTQMEVAYIGNHSTGLINSGNSGSLANINSLPYGALYAPDSTGVRPTPFTVSKLSATAVSSHRPYGTNPYDPKTGTYGPSPYGNRVNNYGKILVPQHLAYANYNGVMVSVTRQSGPLRYSVNYTFGKALSVLGDISNGVPLDPTNLDSNYGIAPYDRTHIFKASYSYTLGSLVRSRFAGGFTNGWEISGITQVQSGQNLQIAGGQSNFNPTVQLSGAQYTGGSAQPVNVTPGMLLGTSDILVLPTLTCDPRSGRGGHTYINPKCFALGPQVAGGPIVNGPHFYPYLHGPTFFASDVTAQKSFVLPREQQLQFRVAAFNFLNHPLPSFNAIRPNEYTNLLFTGVDTATAVPNPASGSVAPGSQFGNLTLKQGRRILEVSVKYVF